jgi:hypothetical protein
MKSAKVISKSRKDLHRDLDGEADVVIRSCRAPGTTHACKNLFPEEVYVSVGFKADLSIFLGALKCELSDLLREECPRLMDRRRVRQ